MNIFEEEFDFISTKFISFLTKGDIFYICGKKVEVTQVTYKKAKEVEKLWDSYKEKFPETILSERIRLNYGEETITFIYCYGHYIGSPNSKSRNNKSNLKVKKFLRDIESQFILDTINQFNPLHEMSFITKKLKEKLKN